MGLTDIYNGINLLLNLAKVKWEVYNMRVNVTLACTECKRRNYTTNKNKRNNPDRIEFKKYCRFCNDHTLHRETR